MRRPRAVFARCRGTFREAPCGRGRGRAAAAGGRADPPGRTAMARRPWPRLPQRAPKPARSRRFCARSPQTCAAEGRAGASSPHIPRPRVRSVPVHGRRGVRSSGRGRARRRDGPALLHPTSPGRAFASFLCTIAAGVRSSGRGRSRRSNSYRAQGGFAPTAAVRRRRAPLRSRSAPRAGRGPRGRSGRRPRSAGRWGGAGRASR